MEGLCGKHAQKQFVQIGSTTSATFASSLNFNQFNNASIYLLGDFVIDVPIFTFNQCAIKIYNGKSIYVQNGRNLVIRGSDLFSCDKLWKGIILDNEARLDLFTSNIEDAFNVINSNENSIINLGSVTMNKNWIGITNSNSKSPLFGTFGLNRFTCNAPLRKTWSKWTNQTGDWSMAGMDFTGCTVVFGNPSTNSSQYIFPSQFDKMNYGVIANDDAIVSIRACSFDALTTHGLWFLNSHLKFQGLINGTSLWPTITNCGQNGITALSSQLDIQNTYFNNNTLNAIQSRFNNLEEYINIRRNLVQNSPNGVSNGIFFWRSSGLVFSTNNIIHNNVINMAGNNPNSIALQIVGVNNATDNLLVDFNNISINEIPAGGVSTMGRNNHGIFYSNMNNSGYGVFNLNSVTNSGNTMQSTVAGWAMSFLNNISLPHTISNNTITAIPNPGALGGLSFPFWNIWCGIHADGSGNLRYCSNSIQGCFQGLHKFNANAVSDAVVRNSILSNWRGLSQELTASFGNQFCRQNTFLPRIGTTNFYNDAAFNTSGNNAGIYTINPNVIAENPLPTQSNGWFVSTNNCSNLPLATCPILVSGGFVDPNDLDERIANGQDFPATDVSYNAWSGRYKLYTAIKVFPTSFLDSIYQQFASQYASTGIDKLYQVETLIHEGTVYTEANGIQKRQYDQLIDSLLNNAIAIDEIINADSILDMNALMLKKRIIGKIDSVRLLRGSLKSITLATNTPKLQQALDILSNWATNTSYEFNDKIVRQYYLKQTKNGTVLSQGAVDTLLGIALSCPFDEGQAVYFARAILQANNYNYVYDYPDKECIAPRSIEQKLTENKVVVFPNPARNEIKLISKNAIVQADMFDMNGATIMHKLSGNINKIDISNLPIGIYVLKIEDAEGNIELHKFIKN